eukprot:TRINITY_DN3325_c0_g1_i3.p4 TRINITY_DN3325_c0_g1~~TRINITY_DN3325_c0_g1_i3.p4  ORF type:complete len:102 (+),score=1.55 TRINITY_DN3325_c0_g1_i3:1294-1599(+)
MTCHGKITLFRLKVCQETTQSNIRRSLDWEDLEDNPEFTRREVVYKPGHEVDATCIQECMRYVNSKSDFFAILHLRCVCLLKTRELFYCLLYTSPSPRDQA